MKDHPHAAWCIVLLLLCVLGGGCQFSHSGDHTPPAKPSERAEPPRLAPGDKLLVIFDNLSAVPPHVEVMEVLDRHGSITLVSNQVFVAHGKTRSELEREIQNRYVTQVNPTAAVRVLQSDPDFLFVEGCVSSPGIQVRVPQATVLQAIASAGGFLHGANRKKVRLTREGRDYVINCVEASRDRSFDMEVLPNDRIFIPHSLWKW